MTTIRFPVPWREMLADRDRRLASPLAPLVVAELAALLAGRHAWRYPASLSVSMI